MGMENWTADLVCAAEQVRHLDLEKESFIWRHQASLLKTAAEAAKRSAELSKLPPYLALIIQSMQTGLAWDGKGIYTGWWNAESVCVQQNELFCDFLGLTKERACAEWPEYVHPDDRPVVLRHFHNAFRERHPFQSCYRLRHYSGEYRWIHKVVHPYKERDDRFAGYVGLGMEVPEAVLAA